jgi:uncharacterized protein (DUF1499 family)
MAPDGLCKEAKADMAPPIYAASAAKLRNELLRVVIAQPRVSHTLADEAEHYDDFVVRSALFRFPDLVAIQAIELGKNKSTLALYSRSVYGRSDLGVNKRRSLGWLTQLDGALKPAKG